MIVFDRPRPVVFHHFRRTAHLISTLEAPWSTEEILDFGRGIGLRSEWLQYPGHWKEHFDLFDEGILRARDAGGRTPLVLGRTRRLDQGQTAPDAAPRYSPEKLMKSTMFVVLSPL